jgi:hypothetical protein
MRTPGGRTRFSVGVSFVSGNPSARSECGMPRTWGCGCTSCQLSLQARGVLVPDAPGAGEYLVSPAAEEKRLGPPFPVPDHFSDFSGVVPALPATVLEVSLAVLVRAAARLDNAVEGDERLNHDGAQLPFCSQHSGFFVGRCCRPLPCLDEGVG